jgi:hypothetical protein
LALQKQDAAKSDARTKDRLAQKTSKVLRLPEDT